MGSISSVESRETAGLTTRLLLGYVREQAGEAGIVRVLQLSGDDRSIEVLEDETMWSTYRQKVELFTAAAEVCEDPLIGRHVGQAVLRAQVGIPVRLLLWTLGTPGQVFRNVAKAAPKFSTVATLECIEAMKNQSVITYQLHDGYEPNRFDCDYTNGLLSQVPALFGYSGAFVEHAACQVTGDERCIYRVRWDRRSRLRRGSKQRTVRHLETELSTLMDQVESLQRVATRLVADDVDVTLRGLAERAAGAVRASGHVLAVRPLLGGAPLVHAKGLDDGRAASLADELLGDGPAPSAGMLVADVSSPRRFYGRLAATFPGGQSFFPAEQRLLAAYAGLAATALDAAASRETSEVLLTLARSLADLGKVGDVCDRIVRAIPELVGSPKAAVTLWDADRRVATIPAALGMGEMTETFKTLEIRPDDTPEVQRMLDDPGNRTFRSDSDDPFISGLLAAFGMASVSVVPIVRLGKVLGSIVLGWDHDADELDPELAHRLTGLAAQAATAIDNARLLERTTHQAMHDPLTGLPNRLLLEDRLGNALARARRDHTSVGLLLLDLDSFKAVNDTHGHRIGDVVLWATAERLVGLLRNVDTAARLGGDEFVVICGDVAGEAGLRSIADRITSALAEPIDINGIVITTTASVGGTLLDGSESDVRVLLNEADEAMYRIKRQRSEHHLAT